MKLSFHTGRNFGDALNPMVFEHYLGKDFFDEDPSVQLIGIGSILGLKTGPGKKIVFSSGYAAGDEGAYGKLPVLDDSYEILCVRGPKTAKLLHLPEDKAIADGAVLLPCFFDPEYQEKKYPFSLVLHHKSLEFFSGWEKVCEEAGFHLIDVRKPVEEVVREIRSSGKLFCEAMHGAIVGDAYGIPWVALSFYPHINFFKWEDWCESLQMPFNPHRVNCYLHDVPFMTEVIKRKSRLPGMIAGMIAKVVMKRRQKKVTTILKSMKGQKAQLSDRALLLSKQEKLIQKLNELKAR